MIKNILKYGAIVGGINSIGLISLIFTDGLTSSDYSELIGYSLMLFAFSFVYFGVKSYRNKQLDGLVTFGKALMLGLLIVLVAATIYVITWLFVYYFFVPDFMDKYADSCFEKMKKNGTTNFDIEARMKEIAQIKELYKNPFFVILITYSEILPIGILVAFISSLFLRRKTIR